VLAGEPADAVFVPTAAAPGVTWRARPELDSGQHAGILTTAQMLYMFTGPRERVQAYQEIMWCVEARSVRVTADEIFALGTANFREEHQDAFKLAARPVCDTCHARLDHAVPFFRATRRWCSSRRPIAAWSRRSTSPTGTTSEATGPRMPTPSPSWRPRYPSLASA